MLDRLPSLYGSPLLRRLLGPVTAGVVYAAMRQAGVVADVPWEVFYGFLFLAAGTTVAAHAWLEIDAGWALHLRLAVRVGLATGLVYATGWGPVFVWIYMAGVVDNLRISGSRVAGPAAFWCGLGVAGGQLAVAAGLAPILVSLRTSHAIAAASYLGLVVLIWMLSEGTSRLEAAQTERKRLQEELAQSQKMQAIGQLAGGIAHDFRNILMALRANADVVEAELDRAGHCTGGLGRRFEHLRDGIRDADELILRLLAFSRQQQLQPRVMDVNVLAAELRPLLHRFLGDDIEIRTELDEGIGPVQADPAQLKQVLMNLALNARDAMPRGGVLTLVTEEAVAEAPGGSLGLDLEPGRHVVLTVRDTGAGIDEETRGRIFEPFFSTKPSSEHAGLGLATVYGIVKQHGGAVDVDSAPGRGSSFFVYLPCCDEPVTPSGELADELPAELTGELGPEVLAAHGGTETVLLCEDNQDIRDTLAEILEMNGYTARTADDGAAALREIERDPEGIDVVVTDVVMPRMDGVALARSVRERWPELPVLLISAHAETPLRQSELSDLGYGLLEKPFATSDLLRQIRELVDRT